MAGQWQDPRQGEPHVQPHVQNSPPQGNYQQQWQPQYPPPPQSPYLPRKSRKGIYGIGCLGLIGLVILVSALASHTSSSAPPAALPTLPTVPVSQQAAPASSAAKAVAKLAATFTGSGTQKTATFTTSATWALSYSFDCSSFGFKGNFAVLTDGGSDFNGVMVNDLAMGKSAVTYAYNDAGTHYLAVTSECAWTLKVYDEG